MNLGQCVTSVYLWYRKHITPWVNPNLPIIFLILWIFAVAVGFFGYFWMYYNTKSLLDILYATLQLFVLRYDGPTPPPNILLQFDRFYAPILMYFSAVTLLVYSYARGSGRVFLMHNLKDHVVICGLGLIGPVVARKFKDLGYPVLAIENNPLNPDIDSWRDEGTIIHIGDAENRRNLDLVRVHEARFCLVATGDDAKNIEIVSQIKNALSGRVGSPLNCYVHIVDHRFERLLTAGKISEKELGVVFDFFSIYRKSAEEATRLWYNNFFLKYPKMDHSILIIGAGRMGENLIVCLARIWCQEYRSCEKRLHIRIVDRKEQRSGPLAKKYSWIAGEDGPCQLKDNCIDITSADFLSGDFLKDQTFPLPTAVFICISNETSALIAAISLKRLLSESIRNSSSNPKTPIFVRTSNQGGVYKFVESLKGKEEFTSIIPFPIICDKLALFNIIGGPREKIARLMYRDSLKCDTAGGGKTMDILGKESDNWTHLKETQQNQFRFYTDLMGDLLEDLGLVIRPISVCSERINSPQFKMINEEDRTPLKNVCAFFVRIIEDYHKQKESYSNKETIRSWWNNLGNENKEVFYSKARYYLKHVGLTFNDVDCVNDTDIKNI
jgi:hypothetical protein